MTSLTSEQSSNTAADAALSPRLAAIVAAVAGLVPGVQAEVQLHGESILAEMMAAGATLRILGGSRDCPQRFRCADVRVGNVRLVAFGGFEAEQTGSAETAEVAQ